MSEPTDAQIEALAAFLRDEPEPFRSADVRDYFPDPDVPQPGPERDIQMARLRAADQAAEAEYQDWARRLIRAVLNA